jgi:hypothetical protein
MGELVVYMTVDAVARDARTEGSDSERSPMRKPGQSPRVRVRRDGA